MKAVEPSGLPGRSVTLSGDALLEGSDTVEVAADGRLRLIAVSI